MANRHSAGAVVLVLALVGPALAGAPEPIRMALHPAAAPTPALRYHLLPQLYEMTPGNAAERYKQAIEAAQKVRKAGSPEGEIKTWLELLPAELPRAKARKLLGRYQEVFRLADRAARCETCDWGFAERLRQKGITADVPEIQDMRLITNLLALRARLNVVEGHIEPALRALQTGFAAAKHVARPTRSSAAWPASPSARA